VSSNTGAVRTRHDSPSPSITVREPASVWGHTGPSQSRYVSITPPWASVSHAASTRVSGVATRYETSSSGSGIIGSGSNAGSPSSYSTSPITVRIASSSEASTRRIITPWTTARTMTAKITTTMASTAALVIATTVRNEKCRAGRGDFTDEGLEGGSPRRGSFRFPVLVRFQTPFGAGTRYRHRPRWCPCQRCFPTPIGKSGCA
jgi:hypothetical protein